MVLAATVPARLRRGATCVSDQGSEHQAARRATRSAEITTARGAAAGMSAGSSTRAAPASSVDTSRAPGSAGVLANRMRWRAQLSLLSPACRYSWYIS